MQPYPLKVGLILPHWTALPIGTPTWWATELSGEVPRWSHLLAWPDKQRPPDSFNLWLIDHFLIRCAVVDEQFGRVHSCRTRPKRNQLAVMECGRSWSRLAAATERIEIGPSVSCTSCDIPRCGSRGG